MARTESTMLALGTPAPDFSLEDAVTHRKFTLDTARGPKGLLVMFICPHCPYVQHINTALAELGREYQGQGVGIVAISSNDIETYPSDAPSGLAQQAKIFGFTFPYLYDETQAVAHSYHAACTPDLYLFDAALKLVYRGQFDSSRPGNNIPVTGEDIRAALDAVIAGKPVSINQRPSIGCGIKWKE